MVEFPRPTVSSQRFLGSRVGPLAVLTAVYFLAGKLGLALAFVHASASAVWAPTGLAIAAVLLWGPRVLPAVFVGAFLVNITTVGTLWTSAAIAAGNTLEAALGAGLVHRFGGGARTFDRPLNVLKFTLFAAVLSTAVSATVGVYSLMLGGLATWAEFGPIWLTWWLGDGTGALIVAPLVVVAVDEGWPAWSRRRLAEALLLSGTLLASVLVVFGGVEPWRSRNLPLEFLCVPCPLYAAFRFGRRETAVATFVLSVGAVWGTLRGYGPFVRDSQNQSLLLLQTFVAVVSIMCLATASVVERRRHVEISLREAREHLERTVSERTRSLSETVGALELEVAARRRAEEELRESELRLRQLLESAPDAMVIVDENGLIAQVTVQAERVFGYSREDLLGGPVERLIPGRLRASHERHRAGYREAPRARPMGKDMELYATRKDGTEFPVEISLSPVETGRGSMVMAAIRDVSERKRAEEEIRRMNAELESRVVERTAALERSNDALRQFVYAASHDLQEPLRTVTNFATLLARQYRGRLDANADELIGFVVDGAQWMHQLLRDLLAYSRISPGLDVHTAVDMNVALDHALESLHASISEASARITHAHLPVIAAVEVQMVQLFQNLISNAIKFRRPGVPPEIHVEAVARASEWIFAVRDNGLGVEPRHAERIFAIFQRLHRREEYPGTGVGLALCKKIVETHGGWIRVEPGNTPGTTIAFSLPCLARAES